MAESVEVEPLVHVTIGSAKPMIVGCGPKSNSVTVKRVAWLLFSQRTTEQQATPRFFSVLRRRWIDPKAKATALPLQLLAQPRWLASALESIATHAAVPNCQCSLTWIIHILDESEEEQI